MALDSPPSTRPAHTALFVDDDPDVLAGVSMALRGRGYRILTAGSADGALDVLSSEVVSVVVTDEHMPVMRGTELLTEVRRRHPRVIRMVLSGTTDPRIISRAINEAGVFRFLLKPCTPDELGLAMTQALDAYKAGEPQEVKNQPRVSLDSSLGQLQVVAQPLYTSQTGRLFAHEMLARLHSDGSTVGPGDLLDAAEASGRLWELERAIRRLVADRLHERPDDAITFVNIHPGSLLDPLLLSSNDPLAGLAHTIVLEITERGPLAAVTDLPRRMEALRALGYRIAIDDMGSGYSGLTAFAAILPDFVKLDRGLIRAIHDAPPKRKLVRSIVAVCHELAIGTVAEGIEDAGEMRVAREIGCDYLQGYLLARPEPSFRDGPSRVVTDLVAKTPR
jgi:EAL domain-containing protein (putative c-di-GMP-specific phosphodiesterase class I)